MYVLKKNKFQSTSVNTSGVHTDMVSMLGMDIDKILLITIMQ